MARQIFAPTATAVALTLAASAVVAQTTGAAKVMVEQSETYGHPYLTDADGRQADVDLLGTIQRKDGATQVTYNGWPLYYYVTDQEPGEATGQDVHGFGDEWYLVTPEGQKLEEG